MRIPVYAPERLDCLDDPEDERPCLWAVWLIPGRGNTWRAELVGWSQNGTLSDVLTDVIVTIDIEQTPDGTAMHGYLTSDAGQSLLCRIADGHSVEFDGCNHVGILTDDAQGARAELSDALQGFIIGEGEVEVWGLVELAVEVETGLLDCEIGWDAMSEADLRAEAEARVNEERTAYFYEGKRVTDADVMVEAMRAIVRDYGVNDEAREAEAAG